VNSSVVDVHCGVSLWRPKNGMYVDEHECEAVMEYCTKVFLPFWFSTKEQMMT